MPNIVPAADLTRAAKIRATRAIESVHAAYYEKGGMRDTEAKLAEQRGAAARHVYSLAVFASKQARTRDKAVALFLGACAYAEAQYKAAHEVANLKDALPTWAVLKSNILRGVRDYQLDPAEHRSEGAFRVAMQKASVSSAQSVARSNVKQISDARTARDSGQSHEEQIESFLATTSVQSGLRVLLAQIIFECESLQRGKTRDAERILREAMDALQPLVDSRKVA